MIGRVPTNYDDGSPIPADWNLCCASCGYLLTGLTSRKCPECGQPFQPRATWEVNRSAEDFPVSHRLDMVCFPIVLMMAIGFVVLALFFQRPVAWVPVVILALVEANVRFGNSDPLKMRLLGIALGVFGLFMVILF